MARKIKRKALKDRILLVSEGKKTEQHYFKGLCQSLRISIEIKDINQTSPEKLLEKVQRICKWAAREKRPFTRVILIFDKDNFTHYEKTKQKIAGIDNFHAFFSEPCFEYWLLLHFQLIGRPFNDCNELQKTKEFKKHFPNYDKVDASIYTELEDEIGNACNNAKNNPHTNVNELVEYLQKIK